MRHRCDVIKGPATGLNGPAFPVVAATCPPVFDFDFSANAYARCFRDLLRGDQITAGLDLGGTGHTSLNVKGSSGSTPTTWLTVYDATPASLGRGPDLRRPDALRRHPDRAVQQYQGGWPGRPAERGRGQERPGAGHPRGRQHGHAVPRHGGRRPGEEGKADDIGERPLAVEGISGKSWYRLIMTVDPAGPPHGDGEGLHAHHASRPEQPPRRPGGRHADIPARRRCPRAWRAPAKAASWPRRSARS